LRWSIGTLHFMVPNEISLLWLPPPKFMSQLSCYYWFHTTWNYNVLVFLVPIKFYFTSFNVLISGSGNTHKYKPHPTSLIFSLRNEDRERDIIIISLFLICVRNDEQKELLTNKHKFDLLVQYKARSFPNTFMCHNKHTFR
jgi:hypothetical protein